MQLKLFVKRNSKKKPRPCYQPGFDEDENSNSTDSPHFPRHAPHYSSLRCHHPGNVSWPDQHPSEGKDQHVPEGAEDATHEATEESDREEQLTPLASPHDKHETMEGCVVLGQ